MGYLEIDPSKKVNDRDTLKNLRLVNHNFNGVVTEALFKEFSVLYGFTRSMPQMRGIAESPLPRFSIQKAFLPSESFFPLAKGVQLHPSDHLPWSRGDTVEWALCRGYRHTLPVRPGVKGRRNHTKQALIFHSSFREYPNRPWIEYNTGLKEFRDQATEYSDALKTFLASCPNLKEIHVAFGLGDDSKRMKKWRQIIQDILMPHICKNGLDKLKISVPQLSYLSSIFPSDKALLLSRDLIYESFMADLSETDLRDETQEGYQLRNVKSLSVVSTHRYERTIELVHHTMLMAIGFPDLESFNFALTANHGFNKVHPFIRPSDSMTKLTTMKLTSLFFSRADFNHSEGLQAFPHLISLSFSIIALELHGLGDVAKFRWTNAFQQFPKWFPKLKSVSLDQLIYACASIDVLWPYGSGTIFFVPRGRDDSNVYGEPLGRPLISPFGDDWASLEAFQSEIAARRTLAGLPVTKLAFKQPFNMDDVLWTHSEEPPFVQHSRAPLA
ncbi:hypothetical protein ABW21_db0203758 [Orbilia brochopaga]|nr:hypothetical protein ABW21_db0203758 [Drechslerella brochopaga]